MLLTSIRSPKDLKNLKVDQLPELSQEIRELLIYKLSKKGGHVAPNLGIVELTVALHYVFDAPQDKFIFDVSHQCYTHKILTGRAYGYADAERFGEVTGFTNPQESEYDMFAVGHTSTSVSLANGVAMARDKKGESYNVVAIIGDGSLSGGEAYEGLNNVVETGTNTIIVVNDNEMSIAENHGGLYGNLAKLRQTQGTAPDNFFKILGFDYLYVENGHSYPDLIAAFQQVKNSTRPVVVHVHTTKGKGLSFAEQEKERWHFGMPFNPITGEVVNRYAEEDYGVLMREELWSMMKADPELNVLMTATPSVLALTPELRAEVKGQFYDCGITEEHAVAMASGIAINGGKAIYTVYASFLQRSFDQLMQEMCINKAPCTVCVFGASVYGVNTLTHTGFTALRTFSVMPNVLYLTPTCVEELFAMLRWSVGYTEGPVMIHVPVGPVVHRQGDFNRDYAKAQFDVLSQGNDVAVVAVGTMLPVGNACVELLQQQGVSVSLVSPINASQLSAELIALLAKHRAVVTIEDGYVEGGYGNRIAAALGGTNTKVKTVGIANVFPDGYRAEELKKQNGMTAKQLAQAALELLK